MLEVVARPSPAIISTIRAGASRPGLAAIVEALRYRPGAQAKVGAHRYPISCHHPGPEPGPDENMSPRPLGSVLDIGQGPRARPAGRARRAAAPPSRSGRRAGPPASRRCGGPGWRAGPFRHQAQPLPVITRSRSRSHAPGARQRLSRSARLPARPVVSIALARPRRQSAPPFAASGASSSASGSSSPRRRPGLRSLRPHRRSAARKRPAHMTLRHRRR